MTSASSPTPDSQPLRRLGKYDLLAEIGRGGMGIVYRGVDRRLQRPVAIKVLAPHLSRDERFVARFRQEAIAAASLDHPHVVTIYDVGQEGDTHYIAMELLAGVSLREWVRRRGPMTPAQASHVLQQVTRALDYAHDRGMVHRDVKPANIVVDPEGKVTLTDFGLVRAQVREGTSPASGDLGLGTLEYMAPEQVLGEAVDRQADVYACGAVLYYLLTGKAPFERGQPVAVAYAQVHDAPPPLRQRRPELSAAVEAVALKALAKRPGERYQSAGELAAALAQAVTDRATPERRRTPTPPPGAQSRRLAPLAMAGLALAAVLLVAAGLSWALRVPEEPTPVQTSAMPAIVIATEPSRATETAMPAANTPVEAAAIAVVASTTPTPRATATLAATRRRTATATTSAAAPSATRPATADEDAPGKDRLEPVAPRLLAPAEGETVDGPVLFSWEWSGDLAPGQAFEVRLWKQGAQEHLGAAAPTTTGSGGRWQQRIDVPMAPAVRQGGEGTYLWTVSVVETNPYRATGREAEPQRLVVRTGSGNAPPNAASALSPGAGNSAGLGLGTMLAWAAVAALAR